MSRNRVAARLVLDFRSWWLAGTGGGQGRKQDIVCHRDAEGFPAMPMSEIKGTLRETAEMLAEAGCGWTKDDVAYLLGPRTEDGGIGPGGALDFGDDACVPDDRKAQLGSQLDLLFERIPATKIGDAGVAADQTLRASEAAVPMKIQGRVTWASADAPSQNWIDLLDMAAAATPAFGKGKFDGFGRACASVEKLHEQQVAVPDVPDDLLRAQKVGLVLIQTRAAIFSERSATEAPHRTTAPTGASLLGWCAARGPYSDFEDPFMVFHAGAVRFGTPLPLLDDGRLGIPFPRNLFAAKGEKVVSEDTLDLSRVRVGVPTSDKEREIQFEALKLGFLAGSATVFDSARGQRLRTATNGGRAERSRLFGYQHLIADVARGYYAEVERMGDISDTDWRRVLECFHGLSLNLGRAKQTGYGGSFECRLVPAFDPTTNYPSASIGTRIRALALSDLALVDGHGVPTCHPTACTLGLPEGLQFEPQDSVISVRRHAPWNGALRARDLERQVIEAGSVLTFSVPTSVAIPSINLGLQCVGEHGHIGYGRIWVNPHFLSKDHLPETLRLPVVSLDHTLSAVTNSNTSREQAEPSEGLKAWLDRRRTSVREELV